MDGRTLKEEAPATVVNGSGAAFYVGKPGTDKAKRNTVACRLDTQWDMLVW